MSPVPTTNPSQPFRMIHCLPLERSVEALVLFSALLVVLVLGWMWGGEAEHWRGGALRGTDLRQHEVAGRLWAEGRTDLLYSDYAFGGQFGPEDPVLERFNYVYGPPVAWVASWFHRWTPDQRYLAWWGLTLSALAAAVALWNRAAPECRAGPVAWAFVLGSPSLFFVLVAFQNTTLTLLCLAGAFLLARGGREFAAGLVLAGSLFKPSLAPYVGLFALMAGRWWFCLGLAAGGLVWLGWSLACGGVGLTVQWLEALAGMISGGQLSNPRTNLSWHGFVATMGFGKWLGWVGTAAWLGVLQWGLWRQEKQGQLEWVVWGGLAWWLLGAGYVPHYEWLLGLPLVARFRGVLPGFGWFWWLAGLLSFAFGAWTGVSALAPVCAGWLGVVWLVGRRNRGFP